MNKKLQLFRIISILLLLGIIIGCAGSTTDITKPNTPPGKITTLKIDVVDNTNVVDFNTLQTIVNAVQLQFHLDLAPVWGIDADFILTNVPVSNYWALFVTDQAPPSNNTFGNHNFKLSGTDVVPFADVFCQFIFNFFSGDKELTLENISNTISHEAIEMSSDPDLKQRLNGKALELSDAVQGVKNGYIRNGIFVSDFVFPSWYFSNGVAPFDESKILTQPGQLAPGGIQPLENFKMTERT